MPAMWRGPGAAVKEGLRICVTQLFGLMKQPLTVPSDHKAIESVAPAGLSREQADRESQRIAGAE
jgi:hypothetical protein